MKPGLKRIEVTLDQLGIQDSTTEEKTSDRVVKNPAINPARSRGEQSKATTKSRSVSRGSIEPFPLPKKQVESPEGTSGAASSDSASVAALPAAPLEPVQPFPAQTLCPEGPNLPRSKPPSLSSHRHAANPNLAIGLLQEIETLVRGWQQELEQVVQQIHALYQEGPIVDAWLESHSSLGQQVISSVGASVLRHAEVEHLMQVIEQICHADQSATVDGSSRTTYRLCGLDPDGKVWSRPCPPNQVPYVSLAIARYQKLRTLLGKKETLENRLMRLVETLTFLHGQIKD